MRDRERAKRFACVMRFLFKFGPSNILSSETILFVFFKPLPGTIVISKQYTPFRNRIGTFCLYHYNKHREMCGRTIGVCNVQGSRSFDGRFPRIVVTSLHWAVFAIGLCSCSLSEVAGEAVLRWYVGTRRGGTRPGA